MNKEKDFIVLTSVVTIAIIIYSGLATILHRLEVLPVTILGIIAFSLILLQNKEKFVNIAENLEKIFFIITLFVIVLLIIVLYIPK
jgi:energy-converting hydrogenase A subunit K